MLKHTMAFFVDSLHLLNSYWSFSFHPWRVEKD